MEDLVAMALKDPTCLKLVWACLRSVQQLPEIVLNDAQLTQWLWLQLKNRLQLLATQTHIWQRSLVKPLGYAGRRLARCTLSIPSTCPPGDELHKCRGPPGDAPHT